MAVVTPRASTHPDANAAEIGYARFLYAVTR
jgi:hypothetical protein